MYLPELGYKPGKTRRQMVELGGLNYTRNAGDGELEDSRGLSCAGWPCLTQRQGRRRVRRTENCQSLYAWDELVTVEGAELLYNGQVVGAVEPGRKQFAVVNTKLCIFPDKKCLDLETMVVEELGARAEFEPGTVRLQGDSLEIDLKVEDNYIDHAQGVTMWFKPYREEDLNWSLAERWTLPDMTGVWGGNGVWPTRIREGDCILLRQFQPNGVWYDCKCTELGVDWTDAHDSNGDYFYVTQNTSIATGSGYLVHLTGEIRRMARIPRALSRLRPGDRVNISGCVSVQENDREAVEVKEVGPRGVTFILPEELQFTEVVEAGAVVVERWVPDLDFICESGNRLFGCSSKDNTIYASALGDPTNWSVHDGLASDSYAEEVGSPGPFTGCLAYGGGVLFWKEELLHRLVGSYPAAYEVRADYIAGLQAGSEGSMVVVNETLYYKGRAGIYAYAGGVPRLISGALGQVRYEKAAAGSDGERYYVSMRRTDTGAWELLSYDLRRGLWMKEDALEARAFARLNETVYLLLEDGVYALDSEADDPGGPVPWEVTFAPFFEGTCRRKYPSRLLLRLELEPGSWVEAQLARDKGVFRQVWASREHDALTAEVPIRPGRCDRYQLRLKGEGRCLIRGLEREFTLGGVRG